MPEPREAKIALIPWDLITLGISKRKERVGRKELLANPNFRQAAAQQFQDTTRCTMVVLLA